MYLYPVTYGENPLFPKKTDFEVITVNEIVGKGVICYRDIKQGEIVAALAGEIIDHIEQHTLQIDDTRHLLDLHFCGYFLHSCSPNVSLDMKNLKVTALQDIKANELLYMDYAETEQQLYRAFPCSCGTSACRGWITGNQQKSDINDPNYQEYYSRLNTAPKQAAR